MTTDPLRHDPAESDFLAALVHRDTPNTTVLAVNAHVLAEDFGDPINRIIYTARVACAANGESGEALLLARLRVDGHLARYVDGRVGVRLSELLTRRVDVLQVRALAVEVLDRAECRLISSFVDGVGDIWAAPPQERRDAMRTLFRRYRALTERLDAARGRAGEPGDGPNLQAVPA